MNDARMVSGLWRRFFADTIDGTLLYVLAKYSTRPFTSSLESIGEGGLWIGLLITLLYTGLLHTSLGSGQTLGKRMLGIQVVKLDGTWLSLPAAFLRFLILAYWTYNWIFFQSLTFHFPQLSRTLPTVVNSAMVFGVFLGTVLMIPFHPLKRGIQDLVAGTIVVYKGTFDSERLQGMANPRREKRTYAALFMIFCLTVSGGVIFAKRQPKYIAQFRDLDRVREIASKSTDLQNISAKVAMVRNRTKSGTEVERNLWVVGFVPRPVFNERTTCALQAKKIMAALKQQPELLKNIHWVNVVIRTGWNIGIASSYESTSYPYQVDMVARDADQYAQGVVWGTGQDPKILGRYQISDRYPALNAWMDRFRKKEFVAIERQVSQWMTSKNEIVWRDMDAFLDAMSRPANIEELRWKKDLIDEWIRQRPNAWLPWYLRGAFYVRYAWNARGGGFGNTVSEVGAKSYEERLQTAQQSLEKANRMNAHQPFADSSLVTISYGLGFKYPVMEKYFQRAMSITPWHRPACTNKMQFLLPKWGGTWEQAFVFSKRLQEKSRKYPLLGIAALQAYEEQAAEAPSYEDYLKRPSVWADIESTYRRIFAAYPTDLSYHMGFAKYAYNARRYDVAAKEFDFVGDRWVKGTSSWPTLLEYNNARAYSYAWVGWDLIEHHHDKEGAALFEKSYEYRKDDSWVLQKLAQWNRMQNQPEKAKEFEATAAALKAAATHPPAL